MLLGCPFTTFNKVGNLGNLKYILAGPLPRSAFGLVRDYTSSMTKQEIKAKLYSHVNTIKLSHGCAICGYNKCAEALEFHHLDPTNKDGSITMMIKNRNSIASINREIAKCEILCSNHHREAHFSP